MSAALERGGAHGLCRVRVIAACAARGKSCIRHVRRDRSDHADQQRCRHLPGQVRRSGAARPSADDDQEGSAAQSADSVRRPGLAGYVGQRSQFEIKGVVIMAGVLRVPRSRGVLSGFLLLLLGVWGGLVAFVGPYLHYAYPPDRAWAYNTGRWWLEILPGLATAIGGVIVAVSANRAVAAFGAWLAALGGAWFVVGRTFSAWPATHIPQAGVPTGSALMQTVEQIGFFSGLGVVIVFIAAFALGRFAVIAG